MTKTTIIHILSVDDDPHISSLIELSLAKVGYHVSKAQSGYEALALIQKIGVPHLAIVDFNMPGMNGFEFCKEVHKIADLPIIMLTGVDVEKTVVEGLRFHVEDYIVKPVNITVLQARVANVIRRMESFDYTQSPVITVDDHLSIDFSSRIAYVAGNHTPLTPIEAKLLHLLIRNSGRVIATDFLIKHIWPLHQAYQASLHVHIHRLRRKIEHNHKKPLYIVSERGEGYVFVSDM